MIGRRKKVLVSGALALLAGGAAALSTQGTGQGFAGFYDLGEPVRVNILDYGVGFEFERPSGPLATTSRLRVIDLDPGLMEPGDLQLDLVPTSAVLVVDDTTSYAFEATTPQPSKWGMSVLELELDSSVIQGNSVSRIEIRSGPKLLLGWQVYGLF